MYESFYSLPNSLLIYDKVPFVCKYYCEKQIYMTHVHPAGTNYL